MNEFSKKFTNQTTSLYPIEVINKINIALQGKPDGRYSKEELREITGLTDEIQYGIVKLNNRHYAVYHGKKRDSEIGSGSSGTAKLMQALDDNSIHVLKIIRAKKISSDEFNQEIKNNITAGIGTGGLDRKSPTKGSQYLLIMKYIEGDDLQKHIMTTNGKSQMYWLDLATNFLKSVRELHEKGLYHVDIKLDNYILTINNKIVPIDFGISVNNNNGMALVETDQIPPNVAPESERMIAEEGKLLISEKTEIYSAGRALYQLLGEVVPEHTVIENGEEYHIEAEVKECVSTSKIKHETTRGELIDLIEKMTAESPDDRPSLNECIIQLNSIKQRLHAEIQQSITSSSGLILTKLASSDNPVIKFDKVTHENYQVADSSIEKERNKIGLAVEEQKENHEITNEDMLITRRRPR